MGEETTLLSPDNHEIRLKFISIETPLDRDLVVTTYALYSVKHSTGHTWRTLANISVEGFRHRLPCDDGLDLVRIQAEAEGFLKAQFAHNWSKPLTILPRSAKIVL